MPRRTRAVKTREPVAASHMAYSRVPRDWRWSTCDVHIGVVWSDRCWSARMVEPNFALMGSRITFLESLMHPDHDSMRPFAPFHLCEEHELVTAASMKDAMDSQHQPSSPRKQIEPGHLFSPSSCCSRSTHSRQAWSASCCTVAAKEAARRSVVITLTMSEGEVHAALVDLTCASTILGPHITSPHMHGAFTFSLSDPNHACPHVHIRCCDRGGVLAG